MMWRKDLGYDEISDNWFGIYIIDESGVKLETKFWWVCRSEELEDNGDDMSVVEILESLEEIYGEPDDYHLTIGESYEQFDEFTLNLCPAPTYIDLIK